jgi:hypothetical protein
LGESGAVALWLDVRARHASSALRWPTVPLVSRDFAAPRRTVPRGMRSTRLALFALALSGLVAPACAPTSKLTPGERKAAKVEEMLKDAEAEIAAFRIEKAKSILDDARPLLRDAQFRQAPNQAELAERFNQAQSELEIGAGERAKRSRQDAENAERQRLEKVATPLQTALADLERRDVGEAQLAAVRASLAAVNAELAKGKEDEARYPAYAEDAKRARRAVERAPEPLAKAQLRVTFRAGPVADFDQATVLLDQTQKEPDLAKRKLLSAQAKAKFQACADAGRKQLEATPAVATMLVLDQLKANTATALVAACDAGELAADKAAVPGKPAAPVKAPTTKKPGKKKR